MKISKIYNEIIQNEPYNDLEIFFTPYDSFEEIPIVSRTHRAIALDKSLTPPAISSLLINLSFFVLSLISTLQRARKPENEYMFLAITFTGFDEQKADQPLVPNLFFYPQKTPEAFTQTLLDKQANIPSREIETIRRHFKDCHLEPLFIFCESRFFDPACNEELVRVYAIPVPR